MKKQAKILIAVVSACVLLVAAYLVVAGLRAKEKAQLAQEGEALAFEPIASAEVFSLTYKGERYDFGENNGAWSCSRYPGCPISAQYVEKIQKSILELKGLNTLPEHDELSVYGVFESGDKLEVTQADGGVRLILLGSELSYKEEFYLKEDEFATVYYMYDPAADLVFTDYSTVIDLCTAPLSEMVDFTTPETFKLEDADSVALTYGGARYTLRLEKAESYNYTWSAEKNGEPFDIPQDYATGAARLLRYIRPVSCVEYKAQAEKLASSGMNEPYAVITLTLKDGSVYTYKFGSLEEGSEAGAEDAKRYLVYNNTGELTLCYEENVAHFINWIVGGETGGE